MISVLGNWIYMALTCFCLGYGFSKFVCKKLNYSISRLENVLFSGLIIVTVYAQFFSLLYKVELVANIVLLLICVGVMLVCRKEIRRDITDYFQQTSPVRKLVILGLVFIWSYFTSQGYIHYDTDLYQISMGLLYWYPYKEPPYNTVYEAIYMNIRSIFL